ncbi:MAG: transposase [Planctomycetes bacterium]|nr:transposase [Planctomycetota bacterium]
MTDELEQVKAAIPHREPFLFVDRVIERSDGRIVTERLVRADEPHFAGHYPGSPLMPGVLICEACFQTGAMLLSDAGAPPADVKRAPRPQAEAPLQIRQRGRLPHWEKDCGFYFVTWRLADSLPVSVREQIEAEREDIVRTARQLNRELSDGEKDRLAALHTEKIEAYLNAGHGECHMKNAECAEVVIETLKKFDGERYELHAWCVMPNHVHVVFQARAGHGLSEIMHSWKSFAAKACNRALGRTGTFWMDESFDRLIRDEDEYRRYVAYTLDNPTVAGLQGWKWVGGRDAGEAPTSQVAGGAPTPQSLRKPVLTRILEAKFRGMVVPGDLMQVQVDLEEKMGGAYVMNGKVSVAGKNVLRVKFIVAMLEVGVREPGIENRNGPNPDSRTPIPENL